MEWKSVPNYSNYEVSDDGRVKNKKRNRLLKPRIVKGYHRVVLCEQNVCRPITVHRLVADVFCPGDHTGLQVNHKDGNKTNNCANNLEWVTQSENNYHAYRTGLRTPPCPSRRRVRIVETGEEFDTLSACARHIQGSKRHVGECIDGIRKTHKGYHFEEIYD